MLEPLLLINNLWVIICAVLVFIMTIAVGFLEVGELGEDFPVSLLKTASIASLAIFFMALVGFNTAFAPTINGIIGDPLYNGLFLGGFSPNTPGLLDGVWWSMTENYFASGLTIGTYFLFEAAFASVTLALVGVITLKKVKLGAFLVYAVVYFIVIWNLPAAWIWNPTGWLFVLGMRDFAGGLVVHGAAGAAGIGILLQIWSEERKKGLKESPKVLLKVSPGWLTLSILFLVVGWFGFNPGSVLAFNESAMTVVITTFLAATAGFFSVTVFRYFFSRSHPDLVYGVNGILMGLIVITPLAGFVSPGSAAILGLIAGPLFVAGEWWFSRSKWFSDPVGLLPGHLLGGIFGIAMIGFFTQHAFAAASGNGNLPDGLLFGGGLPALGQLGLEMLGVVVVFVVVLVLSFVTSRILSIAFHGITNDYRTDA